MLSGAAVALSLEAGEASLAAASMSASPQLNKDVVTCRRDGPKVVLRSGTHQGGRLCNEMIEALRKKSPPGARKGLRNRQQFILRKCHAGAGS